MPRERLEQLLRELEAELERAPDIDRDARDALHEAVEEIRGRLERSAEGVEEEPAPLSERLRESAHHFEEAYPDLATGIARVIDALARLGI